MFERSPFISHYSLCSWGVEENLYQEIYRNETQKGRRTTCTVPVHVIGSSRLPEVPGTCTHLSYNISSTLYRLNMMVLCV